MNYFILLPFLASILQIILIVCSYFIGRAYNDDIDELPYPSSLGVHFPERGFFEMSLSVGSTLAFSVVLLRFLQGCQERTNAFYRKLNKLSFVFGIMMVLGQLIVAVFPDVDGLHWQHFGGACMFFLSALLYMLLQTHLSNKVFLNNRCVVFVRVLCCVISIITTISYTTARLFAPKEKDRYKIPHASEWLAGLSLNIYILTFCSDFYHQDLQHRNSMMISLDSQTEA